MNHKMGLSQTPSIRSKLTKLLSARFLRGEGKRTRQASTRLRPCPLHRDRNLCTWSSASFVESPLKLGNSKFTQARMVLRSSGGPLLPSTFHWQVEEARRGGGRGGEGLRGGVYCSATFGTTQVSLDLVWDVHTNSWTNPIWWINLSADKANKYVCPKLGQLSELDKLAQRLDNSAN